MKQRKQNTADTSFSWDRKQTHSYIKYTGPLDWLKTKSAGLFPCDCLQQNCKQRKKLSHISRRLILGALLEWHFFWFIFFLCVPPIAERQGMCAKGDAYVKQCTSVHRSPTTSTYWDGMQRRVHSCCSQRTYRNNQEPHKHCTTVWTNSGNCLKPALSCWALGQGWA